MVKSLVDFAIKHRKFVIIGVGLLIALRTHSSLKYSPNPNSVMNSDILYPAGATKDLHPQKATKSSRKVNIIKVLSSNITKTHIREKLFYTQGLTFKDSNTLIESAGLYKESAIQYLDLRDMSVIKSQLTDPTYFGEGCEYVVNENEKEIYQLTWREGKVLVWNAEDLSLKKELDFPAEIKEGWGIVKRIEKGKLHFYISNGSDKIFVVDAVAWKILKRIPVRTIDGRPLVYLNELEFVHGKLWANMYYSNLVVIIDPDTGLVDTMLDFALLQNLAAKKAHELKTKWQQDYVLNGIAYDEPTNKLVISGKYWPTIWEIEIQGVY